MEQYLDGGTTGGATGLQPVKMGLPDLHKTWIKTPTPELSDTLLGHLQPTIQKAITTYVGATASPTIRSKAKLMALEAAQKFNPAAGASLTTHVFSHLQGLKRYAGREGMVVGVPERLMLNKKNIDRAIHEFHDEFGRDPSDDELVRRSGVSLRDLERSRRAPAVINEGRFYQDLNDHTPDLPAVQDSGQGQKAWRDFVYHNLPETDKVIMEHTLGLNGKPKLSNMAIAARLKISPAAVSQRKAILQGKLDEFYTLKPW